MKNQLLTDLLFGKGLVLTCTEIEEIEEMALRGSWIPEGEGSPENWECVEVVVEPVAMNSRIIVVAKFIIPGIWCDLNGDHLWKVTHWRPIVWPEEGGKE